MAEVGKAWTPNQRQLISEFLCMDEDLKPLGDFVYPTGIRDLIRSELEEALWPALRQHVVAGGSLRVDKWDLSTVFKCEGLFVAPEEEFSWTLPKARGKVVHRAIAMSMAGRGRDLEPMELVDEAIDAFVRDGEGFGEFIGSLPEAERDELIHAATNACTNFMSGWPPIRPWMKPRIESPVSVPLCDGRLVLKGRYDLALGLPGVRSFVADLKTGDQYPEHNEEIRHYALLETLAHGAPPMRITSYYLDGPSFHPLPVDEEALRAAARRVAEGVPRILELTVGQRRPNLTPGRACVWCPANETCDEGRAYLALRRSER